jgi:hypothetical protein
MVVVLLTDRGGMRSRSVRLVDRLRARLAAGRLDHELAEGRCPDVELTRAVHAQRIVRPSERVRLARSLRRVAELAEAPLPTDRAHALICWPHAQRADADLRAVVAKLERPGPISPQTVARVRTILTDGAGPLYRRDSPDDLGNQLRQAAAFADTED